MRSSTPAATLSSRNDVDCAALAAVALTGGAIPTPAHATDTSLLTKALKGEEMAKDTTPIYGCYDPTDRNTCQIIHADGIKSMCFQPRRAAYRMCVLRGEPQPEIYTGERFIDGPLNEPR